MLKYTTELMLQLDFKVIAIIIDSLTKLLLPIIADEKTRD